MKPKPLVQGVTLSALDQVIKAVLGGLQKAEIVDDVHNVTIVACRMPDHTGFPNIIRIDIKPC